MPPVYNAYVCVCVYVRQLQMEGSGARQFHDLRDKVALIRRTKGHNSSCNDLMQRIVLMRMMISIFCYCCCPLLLLLLLLLLLPLLLLPLPPAVPATPAANVASGAALHAAAFAADADLHLLLLSLPCTAIAASNAIDASPCSLRY